MKNRRSKSTYVARSLASGGVNAQDIVGDDRSVNGSAGSGGDAGNGHLAEFSRDTRGSYNETLKYDENPVDRRKKY